MTDTLRAAEILERQAKLLYDREAPTHKEMLAVAKALRDSGMVLVPREPTMDQQEAALIAIRANGYQVTPASHELHLSEIAYAAMIAAYEGRQP